MSAHYLTALAQIAAVYFGLAVPGAAVLVHFERRSRRSRKEGA